MRNGAEARNARVARCIPGTEPQPWPPHMQRCSALTHFRGDTTPRVTADSPRLFSRSTGERGTAIGRWGRGFARRTTLFHAGGHEPFAEQVLVREGWSGCSGWSVSTNDSGRWNCRASPGRGTHCSGAPRSRPRVRPGCAVTGVCGTIGRCLNAVGPVQPPSPGGSSHLPRGDGGSWCVVSGDCWGD